MLRTMAGKVEPVRSGVGTSRGLGVGDWVGDSVDVGGETGVVDAD